MWYCISAGTDPVPKFESKGIILSAIKLDNHNIKYRVRRTGQPVNVNDLAPPGPGKIILFVEYTSDSQETILELLIGDIANIKKTDSFEGTRELNKNGYEAWEAVYYHTVDKIKKVAPGTCGLV